MASLRIHLLPAEETVRIVSCVLIGLLLGMSAVAQPLRTTRELTAMLNQFMRDASHNNAAGFERFFADNVIYTGSNGQVHTKTEMMRSLSTTKPANAAQEKQSYAAEKIMVHDLAIRRLSPSTCRPDATRRRQNRNFELSRHRNVSEAQWPLASDCVAGDEAP
jgi:hypothetical protein